MEKDKLVTMPCTEPDDSLVLSIGGQRFKIELAATITDVTERRAALRQMIPRETADK